MLDYGYLRNLNFEQLKRGELDRHIRFDEAAVYIERITSRFIYLDGKESELSSTEREIIVPIYNEFKDLVSLIHGFDSEPNESKESTIARRDKIVQRIKNNHARLISAVEPIISRIRVDNLENKNDESTKLLQSKIDNFENTFRNANSNFENTAQAKFSDFDSKIKNAQSLLDETIQLKREAQDFSVDSLAEKYGTIFRNQSDRNKNIAILCLIIFVISIAGVFVLAIFLFKPLIDQMVSFSTSTNTASSTPELAQLGLEYIVTSIIFRLTLLGLALIVVKESLKNFNANMHLYNLNTHRQNALESFKTLISNSIGNDVRDQIIKDISQTIYSNQDDGYLHADKKTFKISEITDLIKALR